MDTTNKATATAVPVPVLHCMRCYHQWIPRKPVIIRCPKCKSPYWDKQRRKKYSRQKDGAVVMPVDVLHSEDSSDLDNYTRDMG